MDEQILIESIARNSGKGLLTKSTHINLQVAHHLLKALLCLTGVLADLYNYLLGE